jgi:hypothetical protein
MAILRLIDSINATEERNSAHAEKTILAVIDAATATEKYEAFRDANSGKRDCEREADVSGRWRQAAVYVRGYDPALAERLVVKGEYWLNPDNWTALEISDARIGLRTVTTEADRLLKYRLSASDWLPLTVVTKTD